MGLHTRDTRARQRSRRGVSSTAERGLRPQKIWLHSLGMIVELSLVLTRRPRSGTVLLRMRLLLAPSASRR